MPISNLVFAGGGVKGLAYAGALDELEKKGLLAKELKNIQRIAGASAGAITALLLGLKFSIKEITDILEKMDFNAFQDNSSNPLTELGYIRHEFGYCKGDYFLNWVKAIIKNKTGNENITFADLKKNGFKDIYFLATNLSRGTSEIFSFEHTPNMPVAIAVRASMSIPVFFTAVRFGIDDKGNFDPNGTDVYVDGGVINNYPIDLFDKMKYLTPEKREKLAKQYEEEDARKNDEPSLAMAQTEIHAFSDPKDDNARYRNDDTLGFLLQPHRSINTYSNNFARPNADQINGIIDYAKNLYRAIVDSQQYNALLKSRDDMIRTLVVDSLDVSTTDFNIDKKQQEALKVSGRESVKNWLERKDREIVERVITGTTEDGSSLLTVGSSATVFFATGNNSTAPSGDSVPSSSLTSPQSRP